MAHSVRGAIVDRLAQLIDESFGGAVTVRARRHPFFEFTDGVVVGVFPSGSSVDFEVRQRGDVDRTVTVGISVMRALQPGDESSQDEQSDQLLALVEQIEDLIGDEARILELPNGGRACLVSLGDSVTIDDDAVEQEQCFLGELTAEYLS